MEEQPSKTGPSKPPLTPVKKALEPVLPKRRDARNWVVAGLFVFVAAVSGFGGGWLGAERNQNVNTGNLSTQKKIVTSQSELISEIAKTVGPSVVSVNVNISGSSPAGLSAFGFYQPEQQQAAGTGIIISNNIIMTNRHVVPTGTTGVSITLSDGTELKDVSVLGRTNDNDSLDIAFLKVNDTKGHTLKPAAMGDSAAMQVGDYVVAIGNALGQFQNTVTSGIISGYGRTIQAGDSSGSATENLDDLFQTDAAINQGNSGGPLVNLNGEVIGVNTATAGDAQNIGFAIPIDDVKGLVDQVTRTGQFKRPYLGINYVLLTADVANQYGLNVTKGAFIAPGNSGGSSVIAGSPAATAGLKEGDIITAVDGTNIDQTHSMTSLISKHQPGDRIELTVVRDGKTLHVAATLGTMPANQ